jgi:molybdenum cofactor biosynthesis protein B
LGYKEHKEKALRNLACAVVTVSDSRTEATDESGDAVKQKLTAGGHRVIYYTLIKNDAVAIKEAVSGMLNNPELQVIITIGGTGVSRRDMTIETISPLLAKTLDGFGELFRSLTYDELGTASIMSRATAGIAEGKVIFCLPGSLNAVVLAVDNIILSEMGHLVAEVTG